MGRKKKELVQETTTEVLTPVEKPVENVEKSSFQSDDIQNHRKFDKFKKN